MINQTPILKWATECLDSKGCPLERPPETVLQTPWSTVIRFSTSKGDFYLKQTPSAISAEPKIIQLMATQFQANVPFVIAFNDSLHCFLMKDSGQNLRAYLKSEFQPNLLYQAVKEYTSIQRSTENHIEPFLVLGVPDWRVDKLPRLYDDIIHQEKLLIGDGLTDKEIKALHDLRPQFLAQCEQLSQFQIPETIGIPDINTNNVLIDTNTNKMTCIDWGESTFTHPFFSLHNYLKQAIIHHGVKESDNIFNQLQDTCLEKWLELAPKVKLLQALALAKKFYPVYSVLGIARLINAIGLEPYLTVYANRPHKIANYFREYIQSGI